MLLEGTIFGLIVLAWNRAGKRGVMTNERKDIYENALEHLTDSTKLRTMADVFEQQGCTVEAAMLRKRADLRDLPPAVKRAQHAAYAKGMASTNLEAIEMLAKAFESKTATGAAASLRKHIQELRRRPYGTVTNSGDSAKEGTNSEVRIKEGTNSGDSGIRPIEPSVKESEDVEETTEEHEDVEMPAPATSSDVKGGLNGDIYGRPIVIDS